MFIKGVFLRDPRRAAIAVALCSGLLFLPAGSIRSQSWKTPSANSYPSDIIGFAGAYTEYGYNSEGDLYTASYRDPVYQHRWTLTMRGTLQGLNHIEWVLRIAVGEGGAIWRTDYNTPGFFIPVERVTDADLHCVHGWAYGGADQNYAVGDRGTIVEYVVSKDSSVVLAEGEVPNLRAIGYCGDRGMVAVGDSGCILHSNDHWKSWKRMDRDRSHFYRGIAITKRNVILLTGHDASTGTAIIVRTDPAFKEWIEYRFPGHHAAAGVRFSDRIWFAYGDDGLLATSVDSARSWQTALHGTRISFTDVMASGWSITAVGRSPVDGHFRSIISSDTGKTWNVWIEEEDGLGPVHIARVTNWSSPIVMEKGYVYRRNSSSNEYPMRSLLRAPFPLYSCVYLPYRGIVLGGAAGRILRSSNDGESWSGSEALSGDVIAMGVLRKTRILALTKDSRIFASDDTGATWSPRYTAPAGREFSRLLCENGDTCLAIGHEGGNGAAWISTDGGVWWKQVLEYGGEITGIDIDSAGAICVCTADARLLRTTDNGATWTTLLRHDGNTFTDVSLGSNQRIALIENRERVLQSTDEGANWTEFHSENQTLDEIHAGGNFWMAWGGSSSVLMCWGPSILEDEFGSCRELILAAVADSTQRMISVGENGMILLGNRRLVGPVNRDLHDVAWHASLLHAVGDGGTVLRASWPWYRWTPVHSDSAGRTLRQLLSFPTGAGVAAGPRLLLRSEPGSMEWIEETSYPGGRLAAAPPTSLYSMRDDGAVYFSEDVGRSWEWRSMLPHPVVDCGAFDVERTLALCLDTSGGIPWSFVYRSTDFGYGWEEVFRMPGRFTMLRLFGDARVLLSGEEGTVFVSENAGDSWTKTRSRFRTVFNDVVCVDPNARWDIEYIFFASQREIDRLLLPSAALTQAAPPATADRGPISHVCPNPATSVLQVGVTGRAERTSRLTLHDLLGREVLVQEIEARNSEISQTTMDVAGFARGMYILRLTGEGVNDARLVRLQ